MNKEKIIYIKQLNKTKYPVNAPYNPPSNFPEYLFSDKELDKSNVIYGVLRNLLFKMNLDRDNFNTKKWNPFQELIKSGDMVMHKNRNKEFSTDCLIAHGSIIRAIVD